MRRLRAWATIFWVAFPMLAYCAPTGAAEPEQWFVCAEGGLDGDAAVRAAIEDLQADGQRFGLQFQFVSTLPDRFERAIVVRYGADQPGAQQAGPGADAGPKPPVGPQGFRIRTVHEGDKRQLFVVGGCPMGAANGLYWVWDRMRVYGDIPDLNVARSPVLGFRITGAQEASDLRNALRYSANAVSIPFVDDLVPWNSEPEATENAKARQAASGLLEAAHRLHIRCLAEADEFSYHPTLLEEFGARLDPADPKLWDALQAKYRRLFTALPELDGVQIRTGELTRVTGTCRPFDIMHDAPNEAWPLEKRYRTFVQKMHEVVVGEFKKIYFQRTWVTNTTEHHSDPSVYKATFTDEVPTQNLYLSPYLSRGDRWYYQPYNPTFNLTPHSMIVLLAPLDYHASHGVNVAPSFPGEYFQGGLQQILAPKENNVKGMQFGVPEKQGWDTSTLTAYTAFRLAWEPDLDLRRLAEDYAAIYLGREAAPQVAEILLLTYPAYKDGMYVKPVAESIAWNTLPQLRLTTFGVKGFPQIDRGKAHTAWLESAIYKPSKGKTDEAITFLDRGRDAARRMQELWEPAASKVADEAMRKQVADSLELTRRLVETNNLYIKTCYAYFEYRDEPNPANRDKLAQTVAALKEAREAFKQAPGFGYKLFGVDQLVRNADEALENLNAAQARLAAAMDQDRIRQAISAQQVRHAELAKSLPEGAVHFLSWQGRIDGNDILSVQGEHAEIEHIQDDPIQSEERQVHAPLPNRPVTVIIKDVESGALHPFVLEQPTEANNYTAKVYLSDLSPGYGRWAFELYYVDRPPEDLGLANPWQSED